MVIIIIIIIIIKRDYNNHTNNKKSDLVGDTVTMSHYQKCEPCQLNKLSSHPFLQGAFNSLIHTTENTNTAAVQSSCLGQLRVRVYYCTNYTDTINEFNFIPRKCINFNIIS